MKEIPFHHVYIHPKILDGRGETMSKSKGNGVDPLDIIEVFGADALRFAMCYLTTETQDVRMPVEYRCPHCEGLTEQTKQNMTAKVVSCTHCKKDFATQWADAETMNKLGRGACVSDRFEIGRNFCNKVWNAARFILQSRSSWVKPADGGHPEDGLHLAHSQSSEGTWAEVWIKSRLADTLKTVRQRYSEYRFSDIAQTLYRFFWNDFCDWYVELAKLRQRSEDPAQKAITDHTVEEVLSISLQLLHPIIPFITEDLWIRLHGESAFSILNSSLPPEGLYQQNPDLEQEVQRFQDICTAIRNIRAELSIPPGEICEVRFITSQAGDEEFIRKYYEDIRFLTRLQSQLQVGSAALRPAASSDSTVESIQVVLVWTADVKEREIARLDKKIEKLQGDVSRLEAKLSNENFTQRAPAEVVNREKERLEQMKAELAGLEEKKKGLNQQVLTESIDPQGFGNP